MSKKKPANSIDFLIETIAEKVFSSPQHRQLWIDDPKNFRLIEFFLRQALDMQNFIGLFKTSYLPAANKGVYDTRATYQSSKYKGFLNLSSEDLRENVHETIRLGYVGLYHKLESFVNGLGEQRSVLKESFLQDDDEAGIRYEDVFKMLDKEFGVLRTDFKKDFTPEVNAIRHTANRVKHDDGFLKGPDDELYLLRPWLGLIPGQRIRIEDKQLFKDMEYVQKYMSDIFQLIMQVTLYFMVSGQVASQEKSRDEDHYLMDYTRLQRQQVDMLKEVIQNLVALMRGNDYDYTFLIRAKTIQENSQQALTELKRRDSTSNDL